MGILLWNTYKKKKTKQKLINSQIDTYLPILKDKYIFLNSYHAWFWSVTKLYHIFEIVYVIWDNKTVNLSNRISIIDTKTSNIYLSYVTTITWTYIYLKKTLTCLVTPIMDVLKFNSTAQLLSLKWRGVTQTEYSSKTSSPLPLNA